MKPGVKWILGAAALIAVGLIVMVSVFQDSASVDSSAGEVHSATMESEGE